MSTQGVARIPHLKLGENARKSYFGRPCSSRWVSGRFPDLGPKVLMVTDGEFTYSKSVRITFNPDETHGLRKELRACFKDRWFPEEGSYPCSLTVFVDGQTQSEMKFILHRRMTSRFIRKDFQLKASAHEWCLLYHATKARISAPLSRGQALAQVMKRSSPRVSVMLG